MLFFIVVSQDYSTRVSDVYVIIGNSALMKCDVPSFVADFVSVNSWINNQGEEYFSTNNNNGIEFLNLKTWDTKKANQFI